MANVKYVAALFGSCLYVLTEMTWNTFLLLQYLPSYSQERRYMSGSAWHICCVLCVSTLGHTQGPECSTDWKVALVSLNILGHHWDTHQPP